VKVFGLDFGFFEKVPASCLKEYTPRYIDHCLKGMFPKFQELLHLRIELQACNPFKRNVTGTYVDKPLNSGP